MPLYMINRNVIISIIHHHVAYIKDLPENRSMEDGIRSEPASNSKISMRSPSSNTLTIDHLSRNYIKQHRAVYFPSPSWPLKEHIRLLTLGVQRPFL